jgi:hypothetical protein
MHLVELELEHYVTTRPQDWYFSFFCCLIFRYDQKRRLTMKNGGYPENGTSIYDGCYRSLVAGDDHIEESTRDRTSRRFCGYYDGYYYGSGISV